MLRQQRGDFVKNLPGSIASLFNGHAKAAPVAASAATERSDERYTTVSAIRELPHPKRSGWISFRSCCSRRWR